MDKGKHTGVWCCERKEDCEWQGYALFRGLAWGTIESPLDEWTKAHAKYCGGKLTQLLAPQEFPVALPVPPIETPHKNLMKFLDENKLNLTDEQNSIAERLYLIPAGGGKSFLVALLFLADPPAQLYVKWMEEKEEEREKQNEA